jgi:hypothetical protein
MRNRPPPRNMSRNPGESAEGHGKEVANRSATRDRRPLRSDSVAPPRPQSTARSRVAHGRAGARPHARHGGLPRAGRRLKEGAMPGTWKGCR